MIGAVDICGNLNQIDEQVRDILDQSLTDVFEFESDVLRMATQGKPQVEYPLPRFAPLHRTRRSGIDASPLAQLGAELFECYMRKLAGLVGADISLLEERLAIPSA